MITEEVDRLIAEAGELPAPGRVLGAVLLRLAAALDGEATPAYSCGALAQQLRVALAEFSRVAPRTDRAPDILTKLRADVLARQQ